MKVSHILEGRFGGGINRTPFEVEFELETADAAGDYQTDMLTVSGFVTVTKDAYSTGDSPTDYEVDIKSIVSKTTGEQIDQTRLTDSDVEWIEEKAISQVTR